MALPVEPTEAQAAAIRRAVVVLGLWVVRDRPGAPEAEATLGLAEPERRTLELYGQARGRFSFFDRSAANWLFGHVIAMVMDRPEDFAIVAPAAAWAIHAIRAADEL
jgi:hypothetical protein